MKNGGGIFLENGAQSHDEAQHEQRVNQIATKIMEDSSSRRRMLSLQELVEMDMPHPHFEQFFQDIQAYFFTINGALHGEVVRGAMLADCCMLIFAGSREAAQHLAEIGLDDTIKHARNFGTLTMLGLDPMEDLEKEHANAGTSIETYGRKTH